MDQIFAPDTPAPDLDQFLLWATQQQYQDIPARVRQRMVIVLADDIAAAFSAESEPEIEHLVITASIDRHGPQVSMFRAGRPRTTPRQAAMLNTMASGWNELDSGFRLAVCHAALYTWPTLLAYAESVRATAAETLRAAVLAYETTARFAQSWRISPPRLHPHALYGAVGTVAALGFLQRWPAAKLREGLTMASTLGLTGPFNQAAEGALVRNAWAAAGVSNGLLCAEWLNAGIGALPRTPNDVYVGLLGAEEQLGAFATQPDVPHWAVEASYHKMYACCQYLHSSIEAILTILQRMPQLVGGDSILSVEVQVHPMALPLSNYHPKTSLAGRFSLPHAAAVAILFGRGDASAFEGSNLHDPNIAALRERITVHAHPSPGAWPNDRPARVVMHLRDGSTVQEECLSAQGGADRPFTQDAVWGKISSLTQQSAPGLVATMQAWHESAGTGEDTITGWNDILDQIFQLA